ncbi:2-amino-4-hydroxy-6-hydroxymethyldihydropteridine diphosphokinase [Ectothiorhodospira shaposhnikovii]|uniref:2-amino-4-hydroxy-6- hydroxymethyldihydropteridine diphosphokinase n=1 Tax=Ectothiorhodospira shaposhnikovii TaxID=1054 RepID=UPI001904D397|nr:2-amino-4-hydroxy-6-hydroxymethyldihydropteridine diphosphokinase [Ectothiorhodospira shaposhnikovii]MBK1674467.1 2-amino-4-hydroxy-6-hydroxymethyldihydropteridine diphosphokinase [Ectothiorhodospira shaposhnikovii]
MTPVMAYIGIGANLGAPRAQVLGALEAMAALPESRLLRQSSLYGSPPMGPADQPDYINAVAQLETRLTPMVLLQSLLELERRCGRVRQGERWGPRTLDLDILLYGTQVIQTAHLTVPHPGIQQRSFVLYPLAEIAPDLWIPGLGGVEDLVAQCPRSGLQRLLEEPA